MAKNTFKITIVGPGAIGCLFGAMFQEAHHQVTMLDIDPKRADKISRSGIHVDGISGKRIVKVKATARPTEVADCDLAVIATKSYDTASAIDSIAGVLGADVPVLTLQNGLGNVELICDRVGGERTVGGITAQGATLVDAGSIIHAGKGKTVIGTPANRLTRNLRLVRDVLESAGLNPQISDDLEATIWSKLIINVGINALTAITRLNNGKLTEFEGTLQVMKEAVDETVAVIGAKKINLTNEDPLAQVKEVCHLTATNISSMLQDVLAGTRTEIDAINGAVARLGNEVNVATPVNSTLAALVRTIESSYDLQVGR